MSTKSLASHSFASLLAGIAFAALIAGSAFAQARSEASAITEQEERAPRLRPEIIVTGETIRLDQLIENIGPAGAVAMFRAPAPGTRGSIRADRILAAARELGLSGIDSAGIASVIIQRPGRTISRGEIEETIGRAAVQRGVFGDLAVVLDDHVNARSFDASRAEELKVVGFMRDARTARFEARLALAGAADGTEAWMVTGTIVETKEIAVPAVDIERGDAIQAKDLVLIKRPASQVAAEIIRPMSELVGMVPRRALRAGEPVKQADIAKPILVEKNQIVTVLYAARGLTLSMRGRAQSAGTMGEVVKVQNPQSKRLVDGTVSGPGQVTVSPSIPVANVAEAAPAPRR